MLILAFETSGPTASVALMRNGALLAEHTINHTRAHSETVLPMAERLVDEMGFEPGALGALAVNTGPGSFTGIRIGVSMANAMASCLNIPVVGINSLRVLYHNAIIYPRAVCALIDARNEQAYAGLFECGAMSGEPCAAGVEEYAKSVPPATLFIGDGAKAYRGIIEKAADNPVFAPEEFSICRASSLCRIAEEMLKHGCDERFVEPLYIRPSQAERLWAQKNGAADGE